MKIGDKVEVVECNRPTHLGCAGTIGYIEEDIVYGGIRQFKIRAINDGPYVNGEYGKKVKSWRVGNVAYFREDEMKILEEK